MDLNPTTLDGIFEDIRRVGAATGCEDEAETYVARLRERVDAVRSTSAAIPIDKRPRVCCIEWIEPLMVASNWMPELIDIAGGRNDLTVAGQKSAYSKWEDVCAFDPQVIVIMPCGFDLPRALSESTTLTGLRGWTELSAVRNQRVYAVDGNAYFNRSGPRIIDSLEILAGLIHPDLFPPTAHSTASQHLVQ